MADDILKRITWYPESYNQGTWQTVAAGFLKKLMPKGGSTRRLAKSEQAKPTLQNCQTTGCIAGTASILAGDIPAVTLDADDFSGRVHVHSVVTPDGKDLPIQDRGAELLCLSVREQSWLFAGDRSLNEVVYALREISQGKPVSMLSKFDMTYAQKQEINDYRHQLRQQKPKVNYVATNRLVPRHAREAARKAEAGREVRP